MSRVILFNKPMNVLSQFTDRGTAGSPRATLSDYIDLPGVYPAGRLDRDSEGLLVLTDDGRLQARIAAPRFRKPKTYLALVEGSPTGDQLAALRAGETLNDGPTRPAEAEVIPDPGLWERDPPVRVRKSITDTWVRLTLSEGRNRQVRRMCAHVGFPVIRLIRWSIGPHDLTDLPPGKWREVVGV